MDYEFHETPNSDGRVDHGTSVLKRVVGAACGAFVLGFAACIVSALYFPHQGDKFPTYATLLGILFGSFGGFAFPRTGHFVAYCAILGINFMVSSEVGQNPKEQIAFFLIFGYVECLFFAVRSIMRK